MWLTCLNLNALLPLPLLPPSGALRWVQELLVLRRALSLNANSRFAHKHWLLLGEQHIQHA
jgi:hypothetical protein